MGTMTEPPDPSWGSIEGLSPEPENTGAVPPPTTAWSGGYPTGGYPSGPYPTGGPEPVGPHGTGYPAAPPPRPRRGILVAAGLGVAIVAFGIGFGVSALTHNPTVSAAPVVAVSSSTAGTGMTTASSAAASGKGAAKKGAAVPRVAGAVLTSGGATWTIKTKAGTTVSVTVDSTTAFGTKKMPAKATDFPAGTKVVVQLAKGTDVSATTVHAVRIAKVAG